MSEIKTIIGKLELLENNTNFLIARDNLSYDFDNKKHMDIYKQIDNIKKDIDDIKIDIHSRHHEIDLWTNVNAVADMTKQNDILVMDNTRLKRKIDFLNKSKFGGVLTTDEEYEKLEIENNILTEENINLEKIYFKKKYNLEKKILEVSSKSTKTTPVIVVDNDDDNEVVEISVNKVSINGKAYLSDDKGVIYDYVTHEKINIAN